MISIVESAKFRLKPYKFSSNLLALTIEEDKQTHSLTLRSYILPSMHEDERDEISCYITEVISDYPVLPYSLFEPVIEVPSLSNFSENELEGNIVYISPQLIKK